jgi:preprotein translocase subunit SecA
MSVHTGIRVRSVLGDIDSGKLNASELSNRIRELELAELRELGRDLLRRAEQDKEADDTRKCIAVVQEAVRRLLDTRHRNGR